MENNRLRKIIARKTLILRKQQGYSERDFALMAGISRSSLRRIESGEADVSMGTVDKVIEAFAVTPSEFFS